MIEEKNKNVSEEKNDFRGMQDTVMRKIQESNVKPRSKYVFMLEKIGVWGVFGISLFFAILGVAFFFFYIRNTGMMAYLRFGQSGLRPFFEHFPFLLFILIGCLIFFSVFMVRHKGGAYKIPSLILLLLCILGISIVGGIAVYAKRTQAILQKNYDLGRVLFLPGPPCENEIIKKHGLVGFAHDCFGGECLLENQEGQHRINVKKIIVRMPVENFENKMIAVLGEKDPNTPLFFVNQLRVLKKQDKTMFGRRMGRCMSD